MLAGTAAGLALASTGAAQVTADALLNKLVERGILKADEAAALKDESLTNNAEGTKFKISNAIKSMELFGDLRFRFPALHLLLRCGGLEPGRLSA